MRPRRPPLRSPEALDRILDRAGESRFARVRPPIPSALWREAVGARIADRVRPISLWSGVLVLRVPTSVWAHELSFLAEDVCGRLRERGIEARQLRFFVGAVEPVERPPERRVSRTVPTTCEIPHEVGKALAGVEDPVLRAVIAHAAASNLAWQSVARPAPPPTTEVTPSVRALRSAGAETARPARSSAVSRGEAPGTRGDGPGRRR
jgi:hypothetical protein